MAQFYDERNQGLNGYGMKEAANRAAMVGYRYPATSESYVSSVGQVVKLGGYPSDQVWPRSSTTTRAQPKVGDDNNYDYSYSPKLSHVSGSPHQNSHRANSPPRGNYSGSGDNSSDDDNDDDGDGVCCPKPNHQTSGYPGPHKYTKFIIPKSMTYDAYYPADMDLAPIKTRPDHHHGHARMPTPNSGSSGPHKYTNFITVAEKLQANNNIHSNNHIKPVNYDRFANKALAPIKTRPDHQQVTDTTEAHGRHETMYKGTIDGQTLAKKYGGLFVK